MKNPRIYRGFSYYCQKCHVDEMKKVNNIKQTVIRKDNKFNRNSFFSFILKHSIDAIIINIKDGIIKNKKPKPARCQNFQKLKILNKNVKIPNNHKKPDIIKLSLERKLTLYCIEITSYKNNFI